MYARNALSRLLLLALIALTFVVAACGQQAAAPVAQPQAAAQQPAVPAQQPAAPAPAQPAAPAKADLSATVTKYISTLPDGFNGIAVHLANHDVAFTAVSRAPLAKLQAYKRRLGWSFPWVSAHGTDFNHDFNVSITEAQQREGSAGYNYDRGGHPLDSTAPVPPVVAEFASRCGTDALAFMRERPGMSAFALEDGAVYHTYSTYARGLDALWGMYPWLDRAPRGRNESGGPWWRRHDEYGAR